MLQLLGFDRIGVAIGDVYLENRDTGEVDAEHGVRIEVRMLEAGELNGSIASSRPISIGLPVWRADLLDAVGGQPSSFNRAHHHPRMDGWEPCGRVFDAELSADPFSWLGKQLSDLEGLLRQGGIDADATLFAADAMSLRNAVPEVLRVVAAMLADVRAGRLGTARADEELVGPDGSVRVGWL